MDNKKIIEKKEISEKTAIKAFINGFISYGFIFVFIAFMAHAFFNWITHDIKFKNDLTATISTSILGAIFIYFGLLFLCRLSTFDVLKKCKLDNSKIPTITKKMSIFFIGCAIFSFMFCLLSVSVKYNNSTQYINKVSMDYYNAFKDNNIAIANTLTNELINKSKDEWSQYSISTAITEGTILFSCLYLIIYQKKMIVLYNKD